jgi:pimeloyl-ACP methyl ester carboxylesterase
VPLGVGDAAARLLPGAKLVVLQKTAHTSYYERAADFNAVLCDFLAGSLGRHQAPGVEYR